MQTIYKYRLGLTIEHQIIPMPFDARFLKVGVVDDRIYLWMEVNDANAIENRHFQIVETGKCVPDYIICYVDSVILFGGRYVGHLYELMP